MKQWISGLLVLAAVSAQATEVSAIYSQSLTSTVDAILALPLTTTGGVAHTTLSISGGTQKLIMDAKQDAASFVSTKGQINGVALQSAIEAIRAENKSLQASDLQLAEFIVNF